MSLDSPVIIVATRNAGKVREFAHAFAPLGKEVKSMFDYPSRWMSWKMVLPLPRMRGKSKGRW